MFDRNRCRVITVRVPLNARWIQCSLTNGHDVNDEHLFIPKVNYPLPLIATS